MQMDILTPQWLLTFTLNNQSNERVTWQEL